MSIQLHPTSFINYLTTYCKRLNTDVLNFTHMVHACRYTYSDAAIANLDMTARLKHAIDVAQAHHAARSM
jgi:hypothetical protein